ncbi:hypothetical protein SNEBB_005064 [Seison nebaliae]|nr:hypothetical protein SNEBB_005064 [Seison nebaliae]
MANTNDEDSVTLHTSMGAITVELYWNEAPKTCRNFVELSRKKYYDNCKFHRIVRNFVIQTGDPTGTGRGGTSIYGNTFKDEIHSSLHHNGGGIVSMANSGPDTNASQFFISLAPCKWLDGKHTIFARVQSGMKIVRQIGLAETRNDDSPIDDIIIHSTTIN